MTRNRKMRFSERQVSTLSSFDYQLIRSKRKTLGISIKPDGSIIVRAPMRASNTDIARFVQDNDQWIKKHLEQVLAEKKAADDLEPFTYEEIEEMAQKALKIIPPRVEHFAGLIGVTYGKITIRNQKTRWGSCSAKGNLNFNCLLVMVPPEVMDSVIVHELCHRKEMNHSPAFYANVLRVCPDYYKYYDWLKKNGSVLIRRMTG